MIPGVSGMDHLVLFTADLDHMGGAFEGLGFRVQPFSYQGDALGSANRTIIMRETYLELLSYVNRSAGNAVLEKWRTLPDGVRALVYRTEDALQTFQGLERRELAPSKPFFFQRAVEDAAGENKTLGFHITMLLSSVPGRADQIFCQHMNRQDVFEPGKTPHPNGATDIQDIDLIEATDMQSEAYYQQLFGDASLIRRQGMLEVALDAFRIRVWTPSAAQKQYQRVTGFNGVGEGAIGLGFAVQNLSDTQAYFDQMGIGYTRFEDELYVLSPHMGNLALRFSDFRYHDR